jgi:hypothetical protein
VLGTLLAIACALAVAAAVLAATVGAAHAAPLPPAPPSSTSPTGPSASDSSDSPGPAGIRLGPDAPAPEPSGPASSGPEVDGGGQSDSPGFFDIGGHIREAIDGWFRDLVTSALDPVLTLLGATLLSTPDVTGGRIGDLWLVALGLANSIFVLFVLAGGIVVMGHETVQTRYALKDIAPRLVVGAIAANASLALAGVGIHLANALSAALLGQGVNAHSATAVLRHLALAPLDAGGIFLILLGLVVAVLAVVLLVTFVVRVAVLVMLVVAAPLALACHALPQTEGAARLWWRAYAGCLAVQVGQALVLITAVRVFFAADGHTALGLSASGSLVDVLVACCLLYVLVKIPGWVARAVFSGRRGSSMVRVVKTAIVYKGIKAGMAAL